MVDSSSSGSQGFFDPFSISSFGFFNAKDPGSSSNGIPPILSNHGNNSSSTAYSLQLSSYGTTKSPPSYSNENNYNNGSPTNFFNTSPNQHSPTNQSNNYAQFNKFPITTFSIEDTMGHNQRNNSSNGGGLHESSSSSMYRPNANNSDIFSSFRLPNSSSHNNGPDSSSVSSSYGRSMSNNGVDSSYAHNNGSSAYSRTNSASDSMYRTNSTSSSTLDSSPFSNLDDLSNLSMGSWTNGSIGNYTSSSSSGNNNGHTHGGGSSSNNSWNNSSSGTNNMDSHHSSSSTSSSGPSGGGTAGANQGVRETGIIEKLLHSYGFIQCCERQARLFFHFSQFDGTIEHLKLGDPVEFEMTYDRRTGKPIASFVTKIGPEVLSEERVNGTVTTELHHESNGELQGRISYENRGECFFLPYCQEDIEGNVSLATGDSVSFQIATNQRSGNLTARYVRLENPAQPVRYRGIVSSIKDSFGFIERADVAKEIFFHFAETRIHEGVVVGDNIEFNIQSRSGKEVASSITKLPFGTVVFEDIGLEVLKGQVLKPVDKSASVVPLTGPVPRSETMAGRLRYRGPDRQELEVMYGEKDQKGNFTMRHGDWVEFQLAVDRRDKQQRATNIKLLEESFNVSGERREEGIISILNPNDNVGYLTCADRDAKVYFSISELLDYTRLPIVGDEVEFTIVSDATSPVRQSGIRIKTLPPGTVKLELLLQKGLEGRVVREPSRNWLSEEALVGLLPSLTNLGLPPNLTQKLLSDISARSGSRDGNGEGEERGVISYEVVTAAGSWCTENIAFTWRHVCGEGGGGVGIGTKVRFDVCQVRRTREYIATNITPLKESTQEPVVPHPPPPTEEKVETLKLNEPSPSNSNTLPNVTPTNSPNSLKNSSSPSNTTNYSPSNTNSPSYSTTPTSSSNNPVTSNAPPTTSSNVESERGNCESPPPPPEYGGGGGVLCNVEEEGRRNERESEEEVKSSGSSSSCLSSTTSISSSSGESEKRGGGGGKESESSKGQRFVMRGYIAALKDGFGFIETVAQDGEIFFHSTSLVGDFCVLEVGQEVEYVVSSKGNLSGKNAADMVKPLPRGTISRAQILPETLTGFVVRPVRGANPEQSEYTGLIEESGDGRTYPFGITSMLNKKETVQMGESVEFQVDTENNAVNIRAIRKKMRATVEAVKGLYGFLSYELDDGKKLFFHTSEVKDHKNLNPGDEVEFVILQNPRNGKSSACSVVKLSETQRPERLRNRLSKMSIDETAPRLIIVRQPYGPDGTRGFTTRQNKV